MSQPLGGLALAPGTWTHLGFVVSAGGSQVTAVVNGFRFATLTPSAASLQLAPLPGAVTLGGRSGHAGIAGWVDELMVTSESPTSELLANHARGTLVQLGKGYTGPLLAVAQEYPAWAQSQLRAELGQTDATVLYACFTTYETELGASHREVPAGTTSVRQQLDFPEGPLVATRPRPDSTKNNFCLSCHGAPGATRDTLTLAALQPGTVPESQDPRRQPLQPPPLLFGLVPANTFGPGAPATPISSPSGVSVDAYFYPAP